MGFLSNVLGTGNNYQFQADPNAAQPAINNQKNTLGGQQQLLEVLKQQAAGQGPNPAQMMLNQATDRNNQENAGFIASQKGINPAIAARLAAQNAAQSTQQSAGQGATLGAQQQVAAQGQQMGVLGQEQQANLSQQQMAYNNTIAQNQINAGVAAGNQNTNAGIAGGVLGGVGSFLGMANGGEVSGADALRNGLTEFGGGLGKALKSKPDVPGFQMPELGNQYATAGGPAPNLGANLSYTGMAPAAPVAQFGGLGTNLQFSHGGDVSQPSKLHAFLDDMVNGSKDMGTKLKDGGHVPGKASVQGNSYKNDTVKALLSPGEVVIPRSVMQSKDPATGAARFVQAVMAKKKVQNVKATN